MAVTSLAVSASLILAGCGGGDGGDDEVGTIVFGYSGPQSGGAALYGENVEAGINLAIEGINELGVEVDGRQYRVELRALDDVYAPATAATNAQRLVEQDGARVILIPHAGGISAAQEINTSRSEFLLAAYSSDPEITYRGNELTAMISPPFTSYARPFVEQFIERGATRLGLLGTASEYGQAWTSMMAEEWESQGGEVLRNNNFDYGSVTDFSASVSQTLAENPDVILVGGPSQPTALVVEEARNQGYEGGFMFMDQAKYGEMEMFIDPELLNNSVGTLPVAEYDLPGTEQLVELYAEKVTTDRPVTSEVGLNYQAVAIFVKAMEVAGTVDDPHAIWEAIPEAMQQVDDRFRVMIFPDGMNENGMFLSEAATGTYRNENGEYTTFELDEFE